MKTFITFSLALLLAVSVQATEKKRYQKPEIENTAKAMSGSESVSKARADSTSKATASNRTKVDASSSVDVAVETGDTLVQVDGDTQIYDFPSNSAYAPPAFSNIRCSDVFGFGYTNKSGSGSAGLPVPRWMSKKIQDCEANADANWLAEAGLPLAAIEARCATRSMRERFGGGMKGKKNQTAGCVTRLKTLARDAAELEGLRSAVDHLKKDNQQLAGKVADLESDVSNCNESRDRVEDAWKECQQK